MTRRWLAGLFAPLLAAAALTATAAPAGAAPGPPDAPEYWFDSWHVEHLWQQGVRGQGVTVAVIDTGVNAALPALAGRVLRGIDFGPSGGDGRTDRDVDEFGHGTAMASIMVGRTDALGVTGLAPGAKILPVALPMNGTTDAAPQDHLAAAIRWSADHGAKIISMSLGGARNPRLDTQPCPADEQDAIFYALRKGAVLLAAGGNRGTSDNAVEEPGVCLGVLAVGAADRDGSRASFSSRHPYLAFLAPGSKIASLSRLPGIAYRGWGTSHATAIASAVLALVWSKYPKLTASQLVARVLATLDGRRARPDPSYGYGLLDGYRAITASVPLSAPNPIYAAAQPFLQRAEALAATDMRKPPAPAPTRSAPPGHFRVGSAPGLLVPGVLAGLGLVLAGLLALSTLLAFALVRRVSRVRRVRGRPAPVPAGLAVAVDGAGVQWHAIVEPGDPPPAAPASPE